MCDMSHALLVAAVTISVGILTATVTAMAVVIGRLALGLHLSRFLG